ncbi:hypothetical protein MNBD_GAMMA17-2282 [hydrothermal vent metagenome]|uniref:Uncharacterized protein n=1 Tax=hydrothermal vent metagenome TaxID=652676 RepID=A0A3B1A112_9ZZZZ
MMKILGLSLALLMTLANHSAIAGKGHTEIKTMSSILAGLNHYPSSTEKKQLKMIVDDSHASAHSRTLAQAMINLDHSISDADKPRLKNIANDADASENERDLANIMLNLNHKASSADKHKLHGMH